MREERHEIIGEGVIRLRDRRSGIPTPVASIMRKRGVGVVYKTRLMRKFEKMRKVGFYK